MDMWATWQDGGWGMWPILVFGLLALTGAARFAWRGEHGLIGFVRWMGATTISSSALGFVTGMRAVFSYLLFRVPAEDRVKIAIEGVRESSSCISFGLIMTTVTCLVLAIGYRRFPDTERV